MLLAHRAAKGLYIVLRAVQTGYQLHYSQQPKIVQSPLSQGSDYTLKQITKNNKGFTLVELLITLVILLSVLTLGYQTFYYIYKSYDKNEESWIVQQDVRMVSDWIDKNMQTAYILEIYDTIPTSFATDFYYIYTNTGSVYIRIPNQETATILAGKTIKMDFSFNELKQNALNYVITGNDLKTNTNEVYTVKGTLLILNITAGKKINKITSAPSGTCIKFKSTAGVNGIKGMYDYVK